MTLELVECHYLIHNKALQLYDFYIVIVISNFSCHKSAQISCKFIMIPTRVIEMLTY